MSSAIKDSDITFTTTLIGVTHNCCDRYQDYPINFEVPKEETGPCVCVYGNSELNQLRITAHYVNSQGISNLASTTKNISRKTNCLLRGYQVLNSFVCCTTTLLGSLGSFCLLEYISQQSHPQEEDTPKDYTLLYLGIIFTPCILISATSFYFGFRSASKGIKQLKALENEAIAELLPKAKEIAAQLREARVEV